MCLALRKTKLMVRRPQLYALPIEPSSSTSRTRYCHVCPDASWPFSKLQNLERDPYPYHDLNHNVGTRIVPFKDSTRKGVQSHSWP